MGMRDLPDVHARSLRAEGIHIKQITMHMLQVLCNTFIAIVTTSVG